MGQIIMKFLNALSSKKERNILMLGLDAAGKSSILFSLKLGQFVQTIPTIGFNLEQVEYKNIKFTIWDVGSSQKTRPLWRQYFHGMSALIYVIDSTDIERLEEAKESLYMVLQNQNMSNIPILIFVNKQDQAQMTIKSVEEKLDLSKLTSIGQFYFQGSCALTGEGIYEGLEWLSQQFNNKSQK